MSQDAACDPALVLSHNNDDDDNNQEQELNNDEKTTTNNKNIDDTAVPMSFSNDFLLKYNCHDTFSATGKIKQQISKCLPPPLTQAPPLPILAGLTRVGKNPKSEIVYLNFDSEENMKLAQKLLTAQMKYRTKMWIEMKVTEHDLKVTHRGGGRDDNNNNNNNNNTNRESGQRRQREDNENQNGGSNEDDNNNSNENKNTNNLAPWLDLPYETQIERKAEHCKRVLKVISRYHTRMSIDAQKVVKTLRDGSCFEGVIQSPQKIGYRNNVQLTAGYSVEGAPILGFNAGAMLDGKASVFPVEHGFATSHPGVVPLVHAMESEVLGPIREKYFNPRNVKSMYDKTAQQGFWRRVQFRFNAEGEVMVDIEVADAQLRQAIGNEDESNDVVKAIKDSLVQFAGVGQRSFDVVMDVTEKNNNNSNNNSNADAAAPPSPTISKLKITSLQFHVYNGSSVSDSECPREVLAGSPTLTETLAGLHFDLSPTDFFQVNRDAMNLLIDKIGSMVSLDPSKTTLLDLCSGTGTLGLAFASKVKQIIGIELVATAVENAKRNAELNGVKNAEYICGRVENELPKVLRKLEVMNYYANRSAVATTVVKDDDNNENENAVSAPAFTVVDGVIVQNTSATATVKVNALSDVIAILDPPRCGVPSCVLKSLRNIPGLKTLIYISCDQRSLENNCEPLTKDKTNQFFGESFLVDKAFGVDLFPQTNHVEMIVSLKR